PDAGDLKRGWNLLQKARAIGTRTQRERDYIEALSAFYRKYGKVDHEKRATAYAQAMEKVSQKYPEDGEAAVFYALSLLASAPDHDTTLENPKKAIAILNKLFEQEPEHPGVAHYLIHAADNPQLAELGLPAARRYAEVAPASPHAVHMPSHIFARLGLWQDDIQSNLKSVEVSRQHSVMRLDAVRVHSTYFTCYVFLVNTRVEKCRSANSATVRCDLQLSDHLLCAADWRGTSEACCGSEERHRALRSIDRSYAQRQRSAHR